MKHSFNKKKNAFETLNVMWAIFASIFLLLALYFIWRSEENELEEHIKTASLRVSNDLENTIGGVTQTLYTTDIIGREFIDCTGVMQPALQKLHLSHPDVLGASLFDKNQQLLCSTLKKEELLLSNPDRRTLSLSGPYPLPASGQLAFVIRQRLGSYAVDLYILSPRIEIMFHPKSPLINHIALYDEYRKRVLLEMTRDPKSRNYWKASHPDHKTLTPTLIEGTPATVIRYPLTGIERLEVVVSIDKEALAHIRFRYFIMASIIILIMTFGISYYLRKIRGQHYSLHRAILHAMKAHQFFPVYQPIIDRRTNTCTGAEVLLRWQINKSETIMPDVFIEYAEQSGLIVPITIQLSHIVFSECQALLQANTEFHIAINLSSNHFTDPHFLDEFVSICHHYNIQPKQIVLEVTERDLMQNEKSHIIKMKQMRDIGFSLAVDDFGTGHASISYLEHFPFNYLKIDRLFIMSIGTGAVTEALNQSIIDMAKRLGLIVIAEGVETLQQLEILEENGAYLMQGWYFSKALPFEQLIQFIRKHG